jgi:valyl-tRNA synthetase
VVIHVDDTSDELLIRVQSAEDTEIISAIEAFGFVRTAVSSVPSPMLINTPWPTFDPALIDLSAERQIALIQSITSAIREIQNRYPAAKGKDVVIQPRDAATRDLIEQSRAIIEALATIHITENSPTATKPDNAAATVLPEGGGQLFIAGVIDKTAETAKLTKRQAELEKLIASGKAKLANAAAVAKAPPQVVQGWRDQLAKLLEELAAIIKNLAELR